MIPLDDVKMALRVTHDQDDDLLNRLIFSAEQECLRFLNRTELPTLPYDYPVDSDGNPVSEEMPSSDDPVAPDVANGIILLVQQDYDGVPETRQASRDAAFSLFWPYRIGLGI